MTVEPKDEAAAPLLENAPPPGNWLERTRRWLTEARPEFRVGTLRYTGFGLLMVFFWLLWGDFCFTLLDTNIPEILPLKLNSMGASDTTNAILNKSIAYAIIFFLAPIVSFRSDRTRTRWGRRIPYLFWSTPFVGLFLVLIGCYETITYFLAGSAKSASDGTAAIIVIGFLIVGWDFANIFVSTIYYYLFNDVVPTRYMSRFFAMFRIITTLASMAYYEWVQPHSLTHFRTIFVCAGIIYTVGFMLMCLFVREGEYPPAPPNVDRSTGFISSAKTYARECFTHRIYWYFFIANMLTYMSRVTMVFLLVRNTKSLGLTLEELGPFNRWVATIALVLQFPAGWVADRWHPLRVYLFGNIWFTLGIIAQCVWIVHDFGRQGNLAYMYFIGLSFLPMKLIAEAAELPMYMRILPKDRYGQFASANAMVRAFCLIFGSVIGGMFIGSMEGKFGDRRYTWIAGWQLLFQVAAIVFVVMLYRQWKWHGGDRNYVPPGSEPLPPPSGFPVIQKH